MLKLFFASISDCKALFLAVSGSGKLAVYVTTYFYFKMLLFLVIRVDSFKKISTVLQLNSAILCFSELFRKFVKIVF